MRKILPLFIFLYIGIKSQQTISGKVLSENGQPISLIQVVNIHTDDKILTNEQGQFTIKAEVNDELRFVSYRFDRESKRITSVDLTNAITVYMHPKITEIEAVKIPYKPTGDLSKDINKLSRVDKGQIVEDAIGLPRNVEKPREKAADVKKDVLLPILLGQVNFSAIYDVVSGDARRKKNLYQYEDKMEKMNWIKSHFDENFFEENKVPKGKIDEFLYFCLIDPNLQIAFREKNAQKAEFILLDKISVFLSKQMK